MRLPHKRQVKGKEEGLGHNQFGDKTERLHNNAGLEPAWLRVRPATKFGTGLLPGWFLSTASCLSALSSCMARASCWLQVDESAASLSAEVDLDFTPDVAYRSSTTLNPKPYNTGRQTCSAKNAFSITATLQAQRAVHELHDKPASDAASP